MGGQVQTGGQNQNQTQSTTSTTTPWAPAAATVGGILGNVQNINPNLTPTEGSALGQLTALGQQGNPFTGGLMNTVNSLLSGGGAMNYAPIQQDAYNSYLSQMTPTATGQYTNPATNPFFNQTQQTISNDVSRQLEGLYAGSGRDPAGAGNFAATLGRGVAEGVAPTFANTYNQERQNQINAASALFGGGTTTANSLTGMNQAGVGNMVQGATTVAPAATQAQQYGPLLELAAEAQRRGIPLTTLAAQMGITLPAAQAFGTTTGTGTTTGQTQNTLPLWQQWAGGALGGLGILGSAGAFNPGGTTPQGGTSNPGFLYNMFSGH